MQQRVPSVVEDSTWYIVKPAPSPIPIQAIELAGRVMDPSVARKLHKDNESFVPVVLETLQCPGIVICMACTTYKQLGSLGYARVYHNR